MFIAHFCLDNEWYWLNRKLRASPRLCPDIFALGRREVLMKDEREAEARAAEQSRWRVKADLIEPGGPPGRPTADRPPSSIEVTRKEVWPMVQCSLPPSLGCDHA